MQAGACWRVYRTVLRKHVDPRENRYCSTGCGDMNLLWCKVGISHGVRVTMVGAGAMSLTLQLYSGRRPTMSSHA